MQLRGDGMRFTPRSEQTAPSEKPTTTLKPALEVSSLDLLMMIDAVDLTKLSEEDLTRPGAPDYTRKASRA